MAILVYNLYNYLQVDIARVHSFIKPSRKSSKYHIQQNSIHKLAQINIKTVLPLISASEWHWRNLFIYTTCARLP